jgi:peptide/nickel transport system permease protein
MLRYLLRRLLELIPTTAGVLLLTFLLFHVVGGSPAEVALGQHANAVSLAAFDARYGYDKPLISGRWAPSRAWPEGTPLPADNPLIPAFPLGTGRWRLTLRGFDSPIAATVRLVRAAGTATNALDVPCRPRALGRGWVAVWDVPDGWNAVEIDLDRGGGARAAAAVRLFRQTAHGLDSQLVHYLGALLRGDLGDSTAYGMRVAEVLRAGVGPSLSLTLPILAGGTLLALLLAMVAAVWREHAPDRAVLIGSTLLMSMNYVVWVLAGQHLLAYKLRLFPIWGFEHWTYLLLPVLIGIVSGLGRDIRFYRTVLLDELHRPYVRTAIAKGLHPARILWRHVLRNSLIPIVTYVSLSVPFLFTGSLLLESFFGIPGLGGVSLNAIHSADMATVRAIVILGALLYQLVNLTTDLCYAWLDPRVRLE